MNIIKNIENCTMGMKITENNFFNIKMAIELENVTK